MEAGRGGGGGGPPFSTLRNLQEGDKMSSSQNESDSGYSITSGSPNSQQENLDTEAGPDIGELDTFNDEEFRPASEVFSGQDFDYLNKHGSDSSTVSHLARQSLYVKFDPLIGGRPSVLGRPSVYRRPEQEDLIAMNSPSPAKPSSKLTSQQQEHQQQQISESTLSDDTRSTNDSNCNETVIQREEMTAREINYQQTLLTKDQRYIELEKELAKNRKELERLQKELKSRIENEEQMKQVLQEYERTISELISDNKTEKGGIESELKRMQEEKDQATLDLQNVEAAFADVHRKYERTKQVVEGFKNNEEQLKKYVEDYKTKLKKSDQKYELLKSHAEEKLEEANKEIDTISRAQDTEIAKLTARLRKAEMQATSLEREVERKQNENQELTNICDELINKVGT